MEFLGNGHDLVEFRRAKRGKLGQVRVCRSARIENYCILLNWVNMMFQMGVNIAVLKIHRDSPHAERHYGLFECCLPKSRWHLSSVHSNSHHAHRLPKWPSGSSLFVIDNPVVITVRVALTCRHTTDNYSCIGRVPLARFILLVFSLQVLAMEWWWGPPGLRSLKASS